MRIRTEDIRSRLLKAVTVLGVISLFVSAVWMLLGDRFEHIRSVGPDTFSSSAIGHKAFKELLEANGNIVHVSRFDSALKGRNASLLVVSEPFLHRDEEARLEAFDAMLADSRAVLVILPKRWGIQSAENPEHIETAGLHPHADVRYVLDRLKLPEVILERPGGALEAGEFSSHVAAIQALPTLDAPQLLSGTLASVVSANQGTVVADVSSSTTPIILVSDPDIFASHGLDNGQNAQLALEIVEMARVGDGPIVFDETSHGFELRPSVGRTLTEFPLALVTIQFLILMLLTLWAALVRFGMPTPVRFGLARGKELSIENTAELLSFGGYANYSTERYVKQTVRLVAERLHLPDDMSDQKIIERLAELGQGRDVDQDIKRMVAEAENLTLGDSRKPRRRELLNLAKRIHEWKQHILR